MRVAMNMLVTPGQKAGVGEYVQNLLSELQEIDLENEYFIFTSPANRHLFPLKNGNFHEVVVDLAEKPRWKAVFERTRWLHSEFLATCRRLRIDVIHIPNTQLVMWRDPPTVVSLLDLAEFRLKKYGFLRTRYRRFAARRAAKRACLILTISHSSAADIRRYLGVAPDRIVVTHLAARETFWKPIRHDEATAAVEKLYGIKTPFVLFVGSLIRQKNLPRCLSAIALLKRRRPLPWRFVCVGKPGNAAAEVRKRISALGLEKDVVLTGRVPDEHLPLFYNAAKLLLFPSLWEGCGLPVLEAMACGCPVITSNVSSLPEVSGDAALLVNPNDEEDIAAALERVESHPELLEELRRAGRRQARRFSCKSTALQTLQAYERACQM